MICAWVGVQFTFSWVDRTGIKDTPLCSLHKIKSHLYRINRSSNCLHVPSTSYFFDDINLHQCLQGILSKAMSLDGSENGCTGWCCSVPWYFSPFIFGYASELFFTEGLSVDYMRLLKHG